MTATTEAAPTTTTLSTAQFADWLAGALEADGLAGVRVWHGSAVHRIYRGRDYVTVTTSAEHYGGPLSLVVGRDPWLVAALQRTCERVVAFEGGYVQVAGAARSPAAPAVVAGSPARCGCCGRPSNRGACEVRTDASGLRGYVRAECMSDFSFA